MHYSVQEINNEAWTYVFGIFVEAGFDKFFERLGVVPRQLRRVVLRNEEEHPHRMQIRIGRLTFGQLDRRYSQRPNISLSQQTIQYYTAHVHSSLDGSQSWTKTLIHFHWHQHRIVGTSAARCKPVHKF